jgi:hypothetical protein
LRNVDKVVILCARQHHRPGNNRECNEEGACRVRYRDHLASCRVSGAGC